MATRVITAIALLTSMSSGFGGQGRLSPDLNNVPSGNVVDVIIQFHGAPSPQSDARIQGLHGLKKKDLPGINGKVYSIPAASLSSLLDDPNIEYVSPDRPISPLLDYAGPTVGADIALKYAWDGRGIGVAVIDSGISVDPELQNGSRSRIVYRQDFVGDRKAARPVWTRHPCCGHSGRNRRILRESKRKSNLQGCRARSQLDRPSSA